jgi:hypothetical protein
MVLPLVGLSICHRLSGAESKRDRIPDESVRRPCCSGLGDWLERMVRSVSVQTPVSGQLSVPLRPGRRHRPGSGGGQCRRCRGWSKQARQSPSPIRITDAPRPLRYHRPDQLAIETSSTCRSDAAGARAETSAGTDATGATSEFAAAEPTGSYRERNDEERARMSTSSSVGDQRVAHRPLALTHEEC